MMNLEELLSKRDIIDKIDWSMTPEKAIEVYLEWGNGWSRGNGFVGAHEKESLYFVLFDWEEPPQVTLIRRTQEGAVELAKVPVPRDLFEQAWKEDGDRPGVGVHSLNKPLKEWVCKTINGPPLEYYAA